MTAKSVCVIADPSGLFTPGEAWFTVLDLVFGVKEGTWSPGVRFSLRGHEAKMIGAVCVRDDRAILEINGSGTYKWRLP